MNEDFPLEEVEIDGGIEIRQSKAVTKFQFFISYKHGYKLQMKSCQNLRFT